MKLDVVKLRAKGWSQKEIDHAKRVLIEAEAKKHPRILAIEKAIYWILLFMVLLGSIAGAWLIEPFLIFLSTTGGIIVIFILGLVFGSIASVLIKDVEDLALHHHLMITLLIPLSAIITSYLISSRGAEISQLINITTKHNPLILGIMYSIGSLIPFAILLWYERGEEDESY